MLKSLDAPLDIFVSTGQRYFIFSQSICTLNTLLKLVILDFTELFAHDISVYLMVSLKKTEQKGEKVITPAK